MEGDHEVPGSKKRRLPPGIVMTYDEQIPRNYPSELGLPSFDIPENHEINYFGMVSVRRLEQHFFNDQITDFNQLTIEERVQHATNIRRRDRQFTLSTSIQHHPHIMKVIAFLTLEKKDKTNTDNINGIVFEYAPQGTVADYVAKNGPLSNDLIFNWALQLARTMSYFHDVHHIMHRDIQPKNVYVFESGRMIKLGNFGYAKQDKNLDHTGRKDANIIYSAPEMIFEGDLTKYSFSADVWSFGMFLYYATHGKDPFAPTACPVGLRMQIEDNESRPTLREPEGPNDPYKVFYDLIKRCWVLDPIAELSARPTFADIVTELTSVKGHFGVEMVL